MCDYQYSERLAFAFLDKLEEGFGKAFSQKEVAGVAGHGGEKFRREMVMLFEAYDSPEKVDVVTQLGKETE